MRWYWAVLLVAFGLLVCYCLLTELGLWGHIHRMPQILIVCLALLAVYQICRR